MTDPFIEEIKKRVEAATPGPWSWCNDEEEIHSDSMQESSGDPCHIVYNMGPIRKKDNAEFIAHARTDIPKLLALVEIYEKTLNECRLIKEDTPEGTCRRYWSEIKRALLKGEKIKRGVG